MICLIKIMKIKQCNNNNNKLIKMGKIKKNNNIEAKNKILNK